MKVPTNKTYEKQNRKLLPATFKKGIIVNVYPQNWTADVYIVGNNQTILKGVPLSTSLDATNTQPGMKCRLDLFDETNPTDMVVAYTYGSGNLNGIPRSAFGNAVVTNAGNTIPHNLGVVPTVVGYINQLNSQITLSGTDSHGDTFNYFYPNVVYEYQPADSTNIYLAAQNNSSTITITWFALKI